MTKWICDQCGVDFERKVKQRFCSNLCSQLWKKENNITGGQFKKGSTPWNKGMKGIHMSPATEFKRGNVSANKLPVGSVTIRTRKRGNRPRAWVKVAEPNVWKPRTLVIWEEHHGPIPKGHVIHQIDRDPLNDDIGNLVMMTRAEHIMEHRPEFEEKRRGKASIAQKKRWQEYRENKREKHESQFDVYYWELEAQYEESCSA